MGSVRSYNYFLSNQTNSEKESNKISLYLRRFANKRSFEILFEFTVQSDINKQYKKIRLKNSKISFLYRFEPIVPLQEDEIMQWALSSLSLSLLDHCWREYLPVLEQRRMTGVFVRRWSSAPGGGEGQVVFLGGGEGSSCVLSMCFFF